MEPTNTPPQQNSSLIIAIAIVVAGLMISGTLIAKSFIDNGKKVAQNPTDIENQQVNIEPVTNKDHILGNPNAKILFIEYSDTECPFCKQFHTTLQQLVSELGTNGDVAWVYRHFPLYKGSETRPPLHSKAGKEAEATECAAELGGNEKFWAYTDRLYAITPSNNGLDHNKLYEIAATVGLSADQFKTCLDSGKYAQKISDAYDAAIIAGAQGTPYSVILDTRSGRTIPLDGGALPYLTLKTIIQSILAN